LPGSDAFDEASTQLQRSIDATELPDARVRLVAIEGNDRGKTFIVDGTQPSRMLLGTSPSCDIRLDDRAVSRRHAAIDWVGAAVVLVDLGSTNGTFVDGVRIREAFLEPDNVVRLGATAFRLEHESSEGSSLPLRTSFGSVIGASTEMRRLYPLCERLAASMVPVVIEGETGTGKEVLAEALHDQGPRAQGPFIVFDCTAVPTSLMEAELFGHERGAFTGATATRRGLFEQADGGTLLIDEIGDLDASLQPKLLRAIERSEVRRIGGDGPIRADVRVLAATRRDLDREVMAGRFRDDLYHRLAVCRIELPPLRARRGDVPLLARHFCRELGYGDVSLAGPLLRRWEEDPWPGNVRELRNAVARHLALGELAPENPRRASEAPATANRPPGDFIESVLEMDLPLVRARKSVVDEFERRYIQRVLGRHDGNVVRAAAASGLARRYFQILRAKKAR
jgi:DNA-binding NtrC family response regulator